MYVITVKFNGKQYKNEEGRAVVKQYVLKTEKEYMVDELEDNEQLNEKLREICKRMLNQYNKEVTYEILNIVEAGSISI